jgi:hypothetical protein
MMQGSLVSLEVVYHNGGFLAATVAAAIATAVSTPIASVSASTVAASANSAITWRGVPSVVLLGIYGGRSSVIIIAACVLVRCDWLITASPVLIEVPIAGAVVASVAT